MMKKSRVAMMLLSGGCILALASGVAACGGGNSEQPKVESGVSTTLVTTKSPDQLSPENAVYAFLQKQSELQSYVITAEGSAVASLAGYEQDIHNITYKNGEDYLNQASSNSVLVQMKHQSFSKGGKVVYRNSFDGEMKVAEKEDYVKVYGFTADDVTLGGYIINAKTLRYVTLESEENDTFTYYLRLAGDQSVENETATESATTAIRLQSKAYGSLDNLPAYSDVDLRLTIKKDWTPVSYTSTCSYEAKKVFSMTVEQTIVSTYSEVNGNVAIPDAKAFNDKLGTAPSEVVPETGETEPLMQLAAAVGGAFDEKDTLAVPAPVSLALGAQKVEIPGELELKLRKDALGSDAIADAFAFRYDFDLSALPLVSGIANRFTVRYPGDGVLLLMLGNKTETSDTTLLTYAADLSSLSLPAVDTSSLPELIDNVLSVERTETGYRITLKDAVVQKLNVAFSGALAELETSLGETGGMIRSLVGVDFTGISVDLAGLDRTTGITITVNGTPSEDLVKLQPALDVVSALGGAMDETLALSLPISVGIDAFGTPSPIAIDGDLFFKVKAETLAAGNFSDAFNLRLDLDLSEVPLLSQLVNTLTVRYPGDGVLLLMLGNRTETSETTLLTYALDMSTLAVPQSETSLPELIGSFLTVEKTATGYRIALKEEVVQMLNGALDGALAELETSLGETRGLIRSLLGVSLTGITVDLAGLDKTTGITVTVSGTPAENLTKGEMVGVSIDTKLINGMLKSPITGDMQVRLDPTAILSGDYFAIAKLALHLDLSSADSLLDMIAGLKIEQVPAYISAMRSLDLFYTGDGILTLGFYSESGLPISVMQIDLMETLMQQGLPSLGDTDLSSVTPMLSQFKIDVNEKGITLIPGELAVAALDKAYNDLIDSLVAKAAEGAGGGVMGNVVKGFLNSYLKATITGVELFLGKTEEGKLTFDLAVKGTYNDETDARLFGLSVTDERALTDVEREDLASDKAFKELQALYVQATAYVTRIQDLIDNVDLTEAGMAGYEEKVIALKAEVDELPENVKSLISNISVFDETEFSDGTHIGLITTQKALRARVDEFLGFLPADDDYTEFTEEQWTALNALYDNAGQVSWQVQTGSFLGQPLYSTKTIDVPAVGDSEPMIKAIGEDRIAKYLTARDSVEEAAAKALLAKVQQKAEEFKTKSTDAELQEALTDLTQVLLAEYGGIAESKKPLVADAYDAYAIAVAKANLQVITQRYAALQSSVDALLAKDTATVDELIPLLQELCVLYSWYEGWNYWEATAVQQTWGGAWTSKILDSLQESSKATLQTEIDAAMAARKGFFLGETSKQIFSVLGDKIKAELTSLKETLSPCRSKTLLNTYKYDFSKLATQDVEGLNALITKMRGLRFLFEKTISAEDKTAFFGDNSDLSTFTTTDLKSYEKELAKYIKTKA